MPPTQRTGYSAAKMGPRQVLSRVHSVTETRRVSGPLPAFGSLSVGIGAVTTDDSAEQMNSLGAELNSQDAEATWSRHLFSSLLGRISAATVYSE